MPFATDQQTIDDLTLFGRDPGTSAGTSVYGMFNHTFTRGGAQLMEDMFRFPLSDADAINRRSGMIRYFSAHPIAAALSNCRKLALGYVIGTARQKDSGRSQRVKRYDRYQ